MMRIERSSRQRPRTLEPRVKRGAFAQAGVIVILAIVVLLGSLVPPAVLKLREHARREKCQHNLAGIAAGIQMYDRDHGKLPHAYIIREHSEGYQYYTNNWIMSILPYLGQGDLIKGWNRKDGYAALSNREALAKPLPKFTCVSSPAKPLGTFDLTTFPDFAVPPFSEKQPQFQAGTVEYFVISQVHLPRGYSSGVMDFSTPVIGLSDVKDGLSTTVLLTEISGGDTSFGEGYEAKGKRMHMQGHWGGNNRLSLKPYEITKTDGKVCAVNCLNHGAHIYSFHEGVYPLAFCDGSVRFFSNSTSLDVLTAVLSRDGGEVISQDDF